MAGIFHGEPSLAVQLSSCDDFYQCFSASNNVRTSETCLAKGREGENVEHNRSISHPYCCGLITYNPTQKPALLITISLPLIIKTWLTDDRRTEKCGLCLNAAVKCHMWHHDVQHRSVCEPSYLAKKVGQLYCVCVSVCVSVCVVIPTSGLSLCVLTASTFKLMDSTLQPETEVLFH